MNLNDLQDASENKRLSDNEKDTINNCLLHVLSVCYHYMFFNSTGEKIMQNLMTSLNEHENDILSDDTFLQFDASCAYSLKVDESIIDLLFKLGYDLGRGRLFINTMRDFSEYSECSKTFVFGVNVIGIKLTYK